MASADNSLTTPFPAPLQVDPLARQHGGRVFTGRRKVRLGDCDPDERLRFDALTRYTQDVSNDDTTDADLADEPGWVVRSTTVDELEPASLGETLTFATFCSGLGGRWAERRLTVTGDRGARYEVATLWVCVDTTTGQPSPLTEQFLAIYGPAADGRKASARSTNPKLSAMGEWSDRLRSQSWQLRRADYDTLGHVNNAAYWAAVEQWMPPFTSARRARVEYGAGLAPAPAVEITRLAAGSGLLLWWLESAGAAPSATASLIELPTGLYDEAASGGTGHAGVSAAG